MSRRGSAAVEDHPRSRLTYGRWVSRELFKAVSALAHALEAKDPYTRGHSARVSVYGHAIARRLGLDAADLATVVLGGELHDIGKIGVPEELLRKHGPLTPDEHRRVMEHTVIGERILQPLLADRPELLGVVRWHHEQVNGGGLPDGLRGAEIPIAARIVAVADAYDAMTSVRPYRPARPVERALDELEAGAGVQFDADCVAAFLAEFGHGLLRATPSAHSPGARSLRGAAAGALRRLVTRRRRARVLGMIVPAES